MAEEKQDPKPGTHSKMVKILVSSGLTVSLLAGGTLAYHYNKPKTQTASSFKPKKATEKQIRLNTDDNQVEDKSREKVKPAAKTAAPFEKRKPVLPAFSLKNDEEEEVVYLVNAPDSGSNRPILALPLDSSDIVLPDPVLPPVTALLPVALMPQLPDLPAEGEYPGEGDELPDEPDDALPGSDPIDDDGSDPFREVALLVPESLFDKLKYYRENGDHFNLLYYGKDYKYEDEEFEKVMEWMAEAVAEMVVSNSLADRQYITSLNLENMADLEKMKEQIRKDAFDAFLKGEIDLYVIVRDEMEKPGNGKGNPFKEFEHPGKGHDKPVVTEGTLAKDVVYYIGKYNKYNKININPAEIRNVDEDLLAQADKAASENDLEQKIEALNKYEIVTETAPSTGEEAKDKKEVISTELLGDMEEREKPAYEDLPAGQELVKLKELMESKAYEQVIEQGGALAAGNEEIGRMVADASAGLLETTTSEMAASSAFSPEQSSAIIRKYRVLSESTGVPASLANNAASKLHVFRMMAKAVETENANLRQSVILASQAVEGGFKSPNAIGKLNELAQKLLDAASGYELNQAEQAYEIISTRKVISPEIIRAAETRKLAISYSKKAKTYLSEKNYIQALFYASESNSLFNNGYNNDVVDAAAMAILGTAFTPENVDGLSKAYQSVISTNGMKESYIAPAKVRKESIDLYLLGRDHNVLEKGVYYLGLASKRPISRTLARPLLQERAHALYNLAMDTRIADPKTAARYFKTIIGTPEIEASLKEQAKSVLNEMKFE